MRYWTLFIVGMALLWGCGKKSTEPSKPTPSIYFAPDSVSVARAEKTNIQLKLNLVDQAIFGLSMRIDYVPILFAFADSTDFTVGDYFGKGMISFVKVHSNSIYLTLSLTKGQPEVKGTGNLGTFTLTGLNRGTGKMEIIPSELNFYDSAGDTISVSNLEIKHAVVSVQ